MRNIMIRTAAAVLATLACIGPTWASKAKNSDADIPPPAVQQARLAKMNPLSPVECHMDTTGFPICSSNGYDVAVTGCDDRDDVFFGEVLPDKGTTLTSDIAPGTAKPLAHLASLQFLCIAATAKKQGAPTRLYVAALPIERVAACKGNHLCATHPVEWIAPKPAEACKWIGHDGEFTGGCAAGWVDEDQVDQFSMGMH